MYTELPDYEQRRIQLDAQVACDRAIVAHVEEEGWAGWQDIGRDAYRQSWRHNTGEEPGTVLLPRPESLRPHHIGTDKIPDAAL